MAKTMVKEKSKKSTKSMKFLVAKKGQNYDNSLPQANDFNKILKIVEALYKHKRLTHSELVNIFKWHDTDMHYYLHAATYLGLIDFKIVENNSHLYSLTSPVKKALKENAKDQTLFFIRAITSNDTCHFIVNTYLETGRIPTNKMVTKYVMNNKDLGLSESTISRRVSSVMSWSKWAIKHMKFVF